MPFGIGAGELLILLLVILLVFGPKRLPEMGRSLGKGMREFKESISGEERSPRVEAHELNTSDEVVRPAPTTREQDPVS